MKKTLLSDHEVTIDEARHRSSIRDLVFGTL
jgi:hypothetical protein